MVSADDLRRIHERIDHVNSTLSDLNANVRENVALCKQCRPKVLGNGGEGYDSRLVRLEENVIVDGEKRLTTIEATGIATKRFVGSIIAATGALAAILSAALRVLGI